MNYDSSFRKVEYMPYFNRLLVDSVRFITSFSKFFKIEKTHVTIFVLSAIKRMRAPWHSCTVP